MKTDFAAIEAAAEETERLRQQRIQETAVTASSQPKPGAGDNSAEVEAQRLSVSMCFSLLVVNAVPVGDP